MSERLWSVTTIIDMGVPNKGLAGWAVKVTAEYAVQQRAAWQALADADPQAAVNMLKDVRFRSSGKAADRGTALHRYGKALALGAPPPPAPEGVEQHYEQFEAFLAAYRPRYIAAEAPVYNLRYRYAGTLDAIVEIGGRRLLLDYKTTDKGPEADSRPPYPEVALQLAAYSRAEVMGLGPPQVEEVYRRRYYPYDDDIATEPMPSVEGAMCLMLSPVDYALHPIRITDEVWAAFLYTQQVARWVDRLSRTVIEAPVAPPSSEQQILADAQEMVDAGEALWRSEEGP